MEIFFSVGVYGNAKKDSATELLSEGGSKDISLLGFLGGKLL